MWSIMKNGSLKLASWNVNGLRACMGKGFPQFLEAESPDVLCLQVTKMQREQADFQFPGYHEYWNSATTRKGYSGTAIFSKTEPLSVTYGIGREEFDGEGRVIAAEYEEFLLVTVYTPNAQRDLARIQYRMAFEDAVREYLTALREKKPVIVCGDMNVAHQEIDLKNPGPNRGNAGFSDQERGQFSALLAAGFTDTFRFLHPDAAGAYSWWSYRFHARQNNAGWRIDYFIVSDRLRDKIRRAEILTDVEGSDHCPVLLELDL